MFVNEPQSINRAESQRQTDEIIKNKLGSSSILAKTFAWLAGTVIGPVISFFKKNGFNIAIAILGFVFLFKIGEAFLGRMSVIFYKEIGFTKTDIALYSKGLGWVTTVIFTLLGGLFLGSVAIVPAAVERATNVQTFQGLGATSLLILVGVAIDTSKQIQTYVISQRYEGLVRQ